MNESPLTNFNFTSTRPLIVIDAGALLSGIDISNLAVDSQCFTTNSIFEDEIKNKNIRTVVNSFIISGVLILLEISPQDYEQVENYAQKSGDLKSLSSNDKGILALCLFLQKCYKKQFNSTPNLTLITDDYSIQNLATLLGITTQSYKYKGIKKYIQWEVYCPNCYKIFHPNLFGKECTICGEFIKRRPKKRTK